MNFVGPSYTLDTRQALQHSINLQLVKTEVEDKARYRLESVAGLKVFATFTGESRGGIETNDRAFVVFGNIFHEVMADGTHTPRGTLNSSTGKVSLAYGLSQVVLVDGSFGYVFTLATNTFVRITSAGFYGSNTVRFIDNYFVFIRPDTQQFYISAINDATSEDPLDFASAESQPDNLVAIETDHSELILFGRASTEIWFNSGATDFPFQRSQGSSMEVGCMAPQSIKQVDNSVFWIGRDKNGAGQVYRMVGHAPQRISNQSVEQALAASTDIAEAVSWAYQDRGLTFYAIRAPGLPSVWVYEVSTNSWHERCDLDDVGQFKASRVTTTLFAFDKHLAGGDDGVLYEFDHLTYKNGNDPLVRQRTSMHYVLANRVTQLFSAFTLDCTTGQAGQGIDPHVGLSWTDNAGKSWANTVFRSIGKVGEALPRVRWTRLGAKRDRVWKLTFADDAPFAINSVDLEAARGGN